MRRQKCPEEWAQIKHRILYMEKPAHRETITRRNAACDDVPTFF